MIRLTFLALLLTLPLAAAQEPPAKEEVVVKMTGTGKVKAAAQGKRHGMIKRHAKFIRQARGTMVLDDSDAKIVKKYMPYAR